MDDYKPISRERENNFRETIRNMALDVYPIETKNGVFFVETSRYISVTASLKMKVADAMNECFDKYPNYTAENCFNVLESKSCEAANNAITSKTTDSRINLMNQMEKEINNNPKRIKYIKDMLSKYPREKYPDRYITIF